MDDGKKSDSILVVGGGIGGIKASIDLAESGCHVYLLERAPFIGGMLSQLDRQFPTNDCGMCKMLPSFGDALCAEICLRRGLDHPIIDIITNAELRGVDGEPGNFRAVIHKKGRYVDPDKCITCGLCVDVCPVEVEDEFNQGLGKRKAIYMRHSSAIPHTYVIDPEHCNKCGECVDVCPTHAIDLTRKDGEEDLYVGAIILALGFEPFDPQGISAYHYREFDDVVTALEFERLMSGTGPHKDRQLKRPSDGKSPETIAFIQCVGSRDDHRNYCSSACCMHSLKEAMMAKELNPEADITIFYMDMRAFGKGYHRYYEKAKELGIKFIRCKVANIEEGEGKLGVNYVDESDEPRQETFDLVVLATGQSPSKGVQALGSIPEFELNKYGFCVTKEGSKIETSKPGIFVCGSFSGPKDIPETITEASAAAAMAGSLLEMDVGEEEGEAKKHEKGEEQRYENGEEEGEVNEHEKVEDEGKPEPQDRKGTAIFICGCGPLLPQLLDMDEIKECSQSLEDVVFVERVDFLCLNLEDVKKKLMEQNPEKILFAACSPYIYETALKQSLASIGYDPFLFELVNIREDCAWTHEDRDKATQGAKALIAMAHEKLRAQEGYPRASKPVIQRALVIGGGVSGMTAALRIADRGYDVDIIEETDALGGQAREVYHTLDGLDVKALVKGLVDQVNEHEHINLYKSSKVLNVKGEPGDFLAELKTSEGDKIEKYGTIIIATGADELKPKEYLYGENESIISQRDLEKMIMAGNFKAENVVMIQCVGLRDEERPYCGRICCSQAFKNALNIKGAFPKAQVHVLYRDIMVYGFDESYYIDAKEKGVNFIRYELEEKPEVTETTSGLNVKVKDAVLNEYLSVNPDLIVLSTGPVPRDNSDLVEVFDMELAVDEDGFFSEANVKYRPLDFVGEGIFVCGLAHSPRSILESITQGEGAAARALSILSKRMISSRDYISEVNERWCVGCEACITACPYSARILDPEAKVAQVVDVLCQGCGVCAVVCPSGATKLRGYKDKQILAMIDEAIT